MNIPTLPKHWSAYDFVVGGSEGAWVVNAIDRATGVAYFRAVFSFRDDAEASANAVRR